MMMKLFVPLQTFLTGYMVLLFVFLVVFFEGWSVAILGSSKTKSS